MTILHTIIMGIVEGITEFLPVSSTAHLEIAQNLLRIPESDFIKSFEIAIQLGAILAVVVLYGKKLFSSMVYMKKILIAFIPTGIVGFILYKFIKTFLLGNLFIAASMLLLGGIVILFFEHRQKTKIEDSVSRTIESLTTKELIILGLAQSLAVIPGVSRSAAVIIAGRVMDMPKVLIVEFSFFLAIPTMIAATGYDLLKSGVAFSGSEWGSLCWGFIVAFIVAFFVIKWLLEYIRKHSFSIFGWYRMLISLIILAFLIH